jgi:hypothetical protein
LVGELNNPEYKALLPLYQWPAHYIKYGDYLNENELQS